MPITVVPIPFLLTTITIIRVIIINIVKVIIITIVIIVMIDVIIIIRAAAESGRAQCLYVCEKRYTDANKNWFCCSFARKESAFLETLLVLN